MSFRVLSHVLHRTVFHMVLTDMLNSHSGNLYIVSTPIGNMADLSPRAIDCLKSVELIACEDTRHTGLLLSRLGIKKRLVAYNDINERERTPQIIRTLSILILFPPSKLHWCLNITSYT
jgi:hypothetical protein